MKESLFSFSTDKFLGINTDSNITRLKPGESPYMKNFRVNDNMSLVKRSGYKLLHKFNFDVKACFLAKLETECIFILVEPLVYMCPLPFDVNTMQYIGSVGTHNTRYFFMQYMGKVYLFGNGKIRYYDTEAQSLKEVEPYRPLIAASCGPYDLSGTVVEDINILTGKVRKQFSPPSPGENKYVVNDSPCQSIDYVKYMGEIVHPSKYYVADDNASLLFDNSMAIQAGINTIEIGYTLKDMEENSKKITDCRYCMFYGGENDTKIFLWGNPDYPDFRFHSQAADGILGADYFPENNYTKIGDGSEICDIIRQYDRQIIFCQNAAYLSYIEEKTDGLGRNYFSFPVRTISDNKGSCVPGQSKLIDNIPVTLMPDGIYKWISTSQRDERNTVNISSRINSLLTREDIKSAKIFDYEHNGELFIYFPNGRVYVYNYRNDIYYMYDNIFAHTFCSDIMGNLYFCDMTGGLYIFNDSPSDNGQPIDCEWQSGFYDMGYPGRKNLYNASVSVTPRSNTEFMLSWSSDNDADTVKPSRKIRYGALDFGDMNFDMLGFNSPGEIKNIKIRMRTKRFNYLKLNLKTNSAYSRTNIHRIVLNGKNTNY
ncbi:MAG: hypothetical protein IJO74_01305 [Clostridia bacterium]|nr:hypothetical protein [Clostridia bacterium]